MRLGGTHSQFGKFWDENNLLLPLLYSPASPAHGLVNIPTELSGSGSETKTKGNRGKKKYIKTEHKVTETLKEYSEKKRNKTRSVRVT
jgi:hypothetical protein